MLIRCALCGHQERHAARGLGERCYERARRIGCLAAFPRRTARDRRAYWREWKRRRRAMQNTPVASQEARRATEDYE